MSRRWLVLCFSLLLLASGANPSRSEEAAPEHALSGPAPRHETDFYRGHRWGWYWYEREPETPEPKKPKKPRRLLETYTIDQLWRMPPERFRKLMNTYLERAVGNPTEENMLDYLILQEIARRKAFAFASAFVYVTQKHPELLGNKLTYPITQPGRKARVGMIRSEISSKVLAARSHCGLILFTRSGCPWCEAQRSILRHFVQRYGWPVKEVSLDTPEGERAAVRFSIDFVPAIILVSRSGDWVPVSAGVVSVSELEQRLYWAIKIMQGQQRPEQFLLYDFEKGTPADPLSILTTLKGGNWK